MSKSGNIGTVFIGATFSVPYISEVVKPRLLNFLYYVYLIPGIHSNSKYLSSAGTLTTETMLSN
jgi:hypothetical protein